MLVSRATNHVGSYDTCMYDLENVWKMSYSQLIRHAMNIPGPLRTTFYTVVSSDEE